MKILKHFIVNVNFEKKQPAHSAPQQLNVCTFPVQAPEGSVT